MSLELRLLDLDAYRDTCARLDAVAAGDATALAELVGECTRRLDGDPFRRRHAAFPWLADTWRAELAAAEARSGQRALDSIAIALLAMPEFQMSSLAAADLSPNLLAFGEDDGGLYGVLRDADRWFDRLIQDRFATATCAHAYGQSMILLDDADRARILDIATAKLPPAANDIEAAARARLVDLLARSLAEPATSAAVSVP